MKNKKTLSTSFHHSSVLTLMLCSLLLCTVSCRKPTVHTVKVISDCSDNEGFTSSWDWLEQESLPPLLSSITQSLSGSIFYKDIYEYDDQQLVRIHKDLSNFSSIEVVFSYDKQGRVATETLLNGSETIGKATFTYNDRNQIVKADYQIDDDFIAKRQHYVAPWRQAAHKAIVERLKRMKKETKDIYNIHVDYVYEGENLASETWDYDGESEIITYTYDNAVNPFQGIWSLDDELLLYPDQLSKNNVLTATYNEEGDIDTERNTYLYDEENYPVAIIQDYFMEDTIRWNYKKLQYTAVDPK